MDMYNHLEYGIGQLDGMYFGVQRRIEGFADRFVHDQDFNNKCAWVVLATFIVTLPFYANYRIKKDVRDTFIKIEREIWRSKLEKELFIPTGADTTAAIDAALDDMFSE